MPYLNSLQMAVESKPSQLISFTFYSHAQWGGGGGGYHDKTGKFMVFTGLLIVVVVVVVVVVVFISTVIHKLVSTAINVYNTDIMES